jgi:hypothetical protein
LNSNDLLVTARKLLQDSPTDTDIRRAVSTAYYALFHHLCSCFSGIVCHPAGGRFERAHLQAYRYVEHGQALNGCHAARGKAQNFAPGAVAFADAFIDLQQRRHDADYNPAQGFNVPTALNLIVGAEAAIAAFDAELAEARLAFAIFLALKPKKNRA